jgi:hypothetical protein
MANPLVLYDNRFEDGTPTATDTAAGYNVLNIRDWKTYTFWKGTAADPMYLTVDCGAGSITTTGANLVSNGADFTGGPPPTGWAASDCTLAGVAGGQAGNCLEITSTGGTIQYAIQNITLTVGKAYRLSAYVKSGTAGNDAFYVEVGKIGVGGYSTVAGTSSGSWVQYTLDITPTDAASYIALVKNTTHAGSPGTMLFDTITLYELTNVPMANTLGIQSHNLGTHTATISVQCSGDNIGWNDALTGFAQTDDLNIMKSFGVDYYARYWRLKIANHDAAPQLAVCCIGEAMEFPTPPKIPVDIYEVSVSGEGKISKTGALLGVVIRNKPVTMEYLFLGTDYTYSWVNTIYRAFWENHASELKPFFFALDLTNFSDLHWLARIAPDGTFKPNLLFTNRVEELEFNIEALWGV